MTNSLKFDFPILCRVLLLLFFSYLFLFPVLFCFVVFFSSYWKLRSVELLCISESK